MQGEARDLALDSGIFTEMAGNVPEIVRVSHRFADLATLRPGTGVDHGLPLVLWRDQIADRPEWTTRENHHVDFASLYVTRHGRGAHVIDGRSFPVARGDVYVMAPGMAHHFADIDQLVFDTLHFQASILEPKERQVLAAMPGFAELFFPSDFATGGATSDPMVHLSPDAAERLGRVWDGIHREWSSGTADGAMLARAGFLRLVVELVRERQSLARGNQSLPSRDSTVTAALRILEAEFDRPLRIARLADAVFLSPDRFTEVFKAAVGRTPRDYLGQVRVRHAVRLLRTTDLAVEQVARQSGFLDGPHLARRLRRETGLAPLALRRQAQSDGSALLTRSPAEADLGPPGVG